MPPRRSTPPTPSAPFVAESVVADPDLLYLDGNSLGRLTAAGPAPPGRDGRAEWGAGLVGSWEDWIDLPCRVGDAIARHLVGAEPGEVVVGDSTTVCLYRAAEAAVAARPGAVALVTDDDNFPTDRYVLEGVAARHGLEYREVASDPVAGPDPAALAPALDGAALLCLSHVAYRSGALADMAGLTRLAHDHGALALWDLSHSAGAVPVDLGGAGADLAVGCGYKYLNGGPGAPAFSYVRRDRQAELRPPIWGWFGRRDQFGMGPGYDAAERDRRLAGGHARGARPGVRRGGRGRCWPRRGSTGCGPRAWRSPRWPWTWPTPGWPRSASPLASPRQPGRRGSHVALAHPDGRRIARALRERAGVVPDFRAPDRIRLGPAPIATRFVDVWDALDRLRRLVERGGHEALGPDTRRVV